jgi:hypothetical protein
MNLIDSEIEENNTLNKSSSKKKEKKSGNIFIWLYPKSY